MVCSSFANPLDYVPRASVPNSHSSFILGVSFKGIPHLIGASTPANITGINFYIKYLRRVFVVKVQPFVQQQSFDPMKCSVIASACQPWRWNLGGLFGQNMSGGGDYLQLLAVPCHLLGTAMECSDLSYIRGDSQIANRT